MIGRITGAHAPFLFLAKIFSCIAYVTAIYSFVRESENTTDATFKILKLLFTYEMSDLDRLHLVCTVCLVCSYDTIHYHSLASRFLMIFTDDHFVFHPSLVSEASTVVLPYFQTFRPETERPEMTNEHEQWLPWVLDPIVLDAAAVVADRQ